MLRLFVIILLIFCGGSAIAQVLKKKKEPQPTVQPSSVDPYYPKKIYEPKKQKSTGKITYNARDKFYDRKEQVARVNRKAEKELQKPQYSDPSYFGHKRPPKKRPPGNLKYCKECGIRH